MLQGVCTAHLRVSARAVAEMGRYLDQGGASDAAGPASAAASGLGRPRPPHAEPWQRRGLTQDGSSGRCSGDS